MFSLLQYHQYQIVGRHVPTEADPEPQVYRMKLWSLDDTRAKSKFWCVRDTHLSATNATREERHAGRRANVKFD